MIVIISMTNWFELTEQARDFGALRAMYPFLSACRLIVEMDAWKILLVI